VAGPGTGTSAWAGVVAGRKLDRFYSTRDGKNAVLKVRVGAGERPELVTYTGIIRPVRWSPRGDWIALADLAGLRVVSPDGKQDRVMSRREFYTSAYGFSKDGLALYGIVPAANRRITVLRVDIATGRETHVTDLGPQTAALEYASFDGSMAYRGFSLHPDGKSFLTSVYRLKSDIWLLEDFDRRTTLLASLWGRR